MIFIISPDEENWTLRKWARYHLPNLSYPALAQIVRKKEIQINKKKCSLNTILTRDNQIYVYDGLITQNLDKKTNTDHEYKKYIIFENEDFIVIDKPYGVASQGESISIAQIFNAYIVHRLDKTTTGIMILAKNKLRADFFSHRFREHKIKKEYLGICVKNPYLEHKGIFESEIDEKLALTEYEIIKSNSKYSLIKFVPLTGKKHQIRKHCSLFNCPIIGDVKYDGPTANRIYLHSFSIQFEENNEIVTFISKMNLEKEFGGAS